MKKLLLTILISLAFIPVTLKAQDYTLLEPLPCIPGTSTDANCKDGVTDKISLNDYVGYVFKFSIALAAFLAVIMIIWGGFEYMTSEVPFIKTNGKDRIQNAVVGLLMVLASYLILATIDPRLVEIETSIPKIPTQQSTSQIRNNFKNDLTTNLENLSAENQLKLLETESKIKVLEKEGEGIKGQISREEIDDEEGTIKLLQVQQEIKQLRTAQYELLAEDGGIKNFTQAYQIINNPTSYNHTDLEKYTAEQVSNNLIDGKYPTSVPNIIQKQYNVQINNILETDAATAQTLGYQRDFYINQIKKEVEIKKHNTSTTRLKELRKEAEQNILNPAETMSAGIPNEQYNKIMQERINTINKVLTDNPTRDTDNIDIPMMSI